MYEGSSAGPEPNTQPPTALSDPNDAHRKDTCGEVEHLIESIRSQDKPKLVKIAEQDAKPHPSDSA